MNKTPKDWWSEHGKANAKGDSDDAGDRVDDGGRFNCLDEEAMDQAIQREITRDIWGIMHGA